MNELGLYIHIPFCKKKCLYCDFTSYENSEDIFEYYVSAVLKEMERARKELSNCKIKTVFIGGGTPSILPTKLMGNIIDGIHKFNVAENAEITIESNPGTITKQSAKEYYYMDINRVSMGAQAWQDKILKSLGRIHTNDEFITSYGYLKDAGFKNINIDIMFSLPNQTLSDWEETLENIIKLSPCHISAYSLIVEEGTPFKDMYNKGKLILPDENTDRAMYYMACDMLNDKGFKQYEISNFSKEGFECRHNIIYWKTQQYIGIGAAAHSYIDGRRFYNTSNIKDYINFVDIPKYSEVLTIDNMISEFMFMGLRMTKGISISEFENRFKKSIESVYGNKLRELENAGLIKLQEDSVFLTKRGIDVSNYVFERLII